MIELLNKAWSSLICEKNLWALFKEKLNKFLNQLNISRISGIRPYRISGRISSRVIWYPAGYRISKKAGLSGRISGASLMYSVLALSGLIFYMMSSSWNNIS
jgi:hypothetical protein